MGQRKKGAFVDSKGRSQQTPCKLGKPPDQAGLVLQSCPGLRERDGDFNSCIGQSLGAGCPQKGYVMLGELAFSSQCTFYRELKAKGSASRGINP